MQAAFDQSDWCFGKITCDDDKMSKTGVADITAVLEYRWLECDPCHIESYAGLLIQPAQRSTVNICLNRLWATAKAGYCMGNQSWAKNLGKLRRGS